MLLLGLLNNENRVSSYIDNLTRRVELIILNTLIIIIITSK